MKRAKSQGMWLWHTKDNGRLYETSDSHYYFCLACDGEGRDPYVGADGTSVSATWTNRPPENYELLPESEVSKLLAKHLENNGYEIRNLSLDQRKGVDIEARKGEETLFIEAEGNKKPKSEERLTPSQRYTHFLRAIGQICLRMQDPSAVFALALPEDDDYRRKVDSAREGLRRLGLRVYWVHEDGTVELEEVL